MSLLQKIILELSEYIRECMSAVADRANKYLQQNLVPGMSGVAQKDYNRRMDEATFPKEIKEHVEKSQG